jgi:hypothetical protein
MAMTTCKECKQPISTAAKTCPGCGAAPAKPTSRLALAFAGVALFAIVYGVANQEPAAPEQPKTAAEIQREREFQQVVAAARGLKAAMKNPASFELVSAFMVQGPTVCLVYRSTNSFNATVTEQYTLSDKVSTTSAAAWNKHCAGKPGDDYSHARMAL